MIEPVIMPDTLLNRLYTLYYAIYTPRLRGIYYYHLRFTGKRKAKSS